MSADLHRVDAGAVVADLDVDLAALVEGAQEDPALGGLALGDAVGGRLDAVIHGVPHDVGQRILDGLDDGLVEVRLLAFHVHPHLLAAGGGQVAHDARELAPDVADRLHARLHDAFLQLGGHQVEAPRGADERGVGLRGRELDDLVAGQDELPDQVHQLVEQADVHAQRRVGHALAPLLATGRAAVVARPAVLTRAAIVGRGGGRRRGSGLRHGRLDDRRDGRGDGRGRRCLGDGGGRHGGLGRRLLPALVEARQEGHQLAVVGVAFLSVMLDRLQDLPDGIDHRQQRAGHLGVEAQLEVAELAQQVLTDVRDGLELGEAEEPARALDRVNRPKDAPQAFAVLGILLERHEVAVQAIEVLVAFDQELFDQIFLLVHVISVPVVNAAGSCGGKSHAGCRAGARTRLCPETRIAGLRSPRRHVSVRVLPCRAADTRRGVRARAGRRPTARVCLLRPERAHANDTDEIGAPRGAFNRRQHGVPWRVTTQPRSGRPGGSRAR
ncbi:MAG: hypothetical protein R2712_04940 [Vicinamibacterales bacterium]